MIINTKLQSPISLLSSIEPMNVFSGVSRKSALIVAVALAIIGALAALFIYHRNSSASKVVPNNQPHQTPKIPTQDNQNPKTTPNNADTGSASQLTNSATNTSATDQQATPSIPAIDLTQLELDDLYVHWKKLRNDDATPKQIDDVVEAIQKKIRASSPKVLDDDIGDKLSVLSSLSLMTRFASPTNSRYLRGALDDLVQRWFDTKSQEFQSDLNASNVWLRFGTIVKALDTKTLKTQLTDSEIRFLSFASRHVGTINCGKDVTDERLEKLVKACPEIQHLVFESSQITNTGLAHLKGLPGLKTLSLVCHEQITDEGLENLKGLVTLEELDLTGCNKISDKGLVHLQGLIAMKKLKLRECDITDDGLVNLTGMAALEELDLGMCDKLADQALEQIGKLIKLKKLVLSSSLITDKGLANLANLVDLQILELIGCKEISDDGLAILAKLVKLQILVLRGCEKVIGSSFKYFRGLVDLQQLSLSECKQLQRSYFHYVGFLKSLQKLDLSHTPVEDVDLINLKELAKLRELSLLRCNEISDDALMHIKDLPLEELSIGGCTQVSASGVTMWLPGLTALKHLFARGCPNITDESVVYVKKCLPQLKFDK